MQLLRQMFSRRWLLATAIVLATTAIFIRLGFWQLDRLEQRRAFNAQLAAVLNSEPLLLPQDAAPTDPDLLRNRDVIATGSYDFENQKLLVLQSWGGRNGVNLITPLVFSDGERAVLVNRGWIPDAESDLETIAARYNVPASGPVQGYIALSERLRRQSDGAVAVRPANEIYRVDVNRIASELPYTLLDFYIIEAPPENDLETLPFRRAKEGDLDEGSHLSYAIQWFLFALVLVILYPVFIRQRTQQ